ncbi:MAG: hypothetical protein LBV12_06745 [Puniceicoccales bacterium]|jgi:hypothetical protein|nr:hypothetical protein [Puniceicoccales bacterium]
MKPRLSRFKLKLLGAMVVFVVAILAWEYWPREKPSVTLADGTVITVEKVEMVSLWKEKFRIWLGRELKLGEFFTNIVGWKIDWNKYPVDFGMYPEAYDYLVTTDVSIIPPERFIHKPVDWLDAKDHDVVRIDGELVNRQAGGRAQGIILRKTDQRGRFQSCDLMEEKKNFKAMRFYYRRLAGAQEVVDIPLDGSAVLPAQRVMQTGSPDKLVGYDIQHAHIDDPMSVRWLDREIDYKWMGDDLTVRVESLPVQFGENNGVKVFEKEKDITADFHIKRRISPPLEERVTARYWVVSNLFFPKSPDRVPPTKRLSLPEVKIPPSGEYLEWKSDVLRPGFGNYHLFLFGPGAYCISTNYDVHDAFEEPINEICVDIAAPSRNANRGQFAAVLLKSGYFEPMFVKKQSRTGLSMPMNRRYFLIETPVPFFCTVPLGRGEVPRHEQVLLLVRQRGMQEWEQTSISADSWLPIMALNKGRARPGDTIQLDLYNLVLPEYTTCITPADAEREAWKAHWEATKQEIPPKP